MEVIYPKACGVDVHKSFIVAVICDSTSVKPQYLRKHFSTFNNSLIEFRKVNLLILQMLQKLKLLIRIK